VNTTPPVAVLDMDIQRDDTTDWSHRVDRLDCYAIGSLDLARYAGLIVTPTVDQEHLARQHRVIRDYLDRGGVVVFGGHLHRDWLPGASLFVPLITGRWTVTAWWRWLTIRSFAAWVPS
jgi:hypothetical protein